MIDPKTFSSFTADCGMPVYSAVRDVPWVCTMLVIKTGTLHDPIGKEGTAHLLEHVLHAGTQGYTYHGYGELQRWLENRPFDLVPASTQMGSMQVQGQVTLEDVGEWFRFLRNFIQSPSFTEDFETDREIVRAERAARKKSPRAVKIEAARLAALGLGMHRWATATGLPEDDVLNAIGMEDVRTFHARHFHPRNMVLLTVGGLTDEQMPLFINEHFHPESAPWEPIPQDPLTFGGPLERERRFAPRDGETASTVRISYNWRFPQGRESVSVFTRNILNSYFMEELRERRRLVYGVSPRCSVSPVGEEFCITCRVDSQNEHEVRTAIENALRRPENLADLSSRFIKPLWKEAVFSEYSSSRLLQDAWGDLLFSGSIKKVSERIDDLKKVTTEEVAAFIRNTLDPSKAYVELVEDA